MRETNQPTKRLHHKSVTAILAALGILIAFAFILTLPVSAISTTRTLDTVADFNDGTFYHTGLTEDPAAGGDGNGEVRLLNVGINPVTWNQNVNAQNLPARWGHGGAYHNDHLYISGGNTSPSAQTALSDVRFATINTDHTFTSFVATTSLPEARWLHGMAVLNGYLYVIGGLNNAAVQQSTVYKAPINSDGTVGAWSPTAALPVPLSDTGVIVVGNRIYVIGGDKGTGDEPIVNTVYYASPDGSGNIANWTQGSNFPLNVSRHAVATWGGRVYVTGGADFSTSTYFPYAYYGSPNGSGDITWQQTLSMPVNLIYAAGAAFADQLYIVGGAFNFGSTLENNIRSNLMDSTGSLGTYTWTSDPVLSSPRQRAVALMTKDGWLYVIQGQSGNLAQGGTPLGTIDYGPTVSAGATKFAPDGTYDSPVIDLQNSNPIMSVRFAKNRPNGTGLSFQYRVSDDPAFTGVPYGAVVDATLGSADQTIDINSTARYIQLRVNLTASSDISVTPVLNRVDITYDAPATATPTTTSTDEPPATSTGTVSPTPTSTDAATSTPTPVTSATPTSTPCSGKPSRATLVSPGKNASLLVRAVPLAWQANPCATKFKIIGKYDNKKGERAFKKANATGSTWTTKKLDKGRTVYWKVRACNAIGCSKWSGWWHFKVSKQAK